MPVTKLAQSLLDKYLRRVAGHRSGVALTKLGAIMLRKLADGDIFRQFADDLDAGNFSDRSLGKMPDKIFFKLKKQFENKYPNPKTRPSFYKRNGTFEIPEYFIDKGQMKHIHDRRMLKNRYTSKEIAELLEYCTQHGAVAKSFHHPGNEMALIARRPAPGRHGDTDTIIVSPMGGKAYIHTAYTGSYDRAMDSLRPGHLRAYR